MNIRDAVGVITGAAGGVGGALALELVRREVGGLALVDSDESVESVARAVNEAARDWVALSFVGEVTDATLRRRVFEETSEKCGRANICVPLAGMSRKQKAITTHGGRAEPTVYPVETFRQLLEVNLMAPIYWALEMVAGIAERRERAGLVNWQSNEGLQGMIVFVGSGGCAAESGQLGRTAAKAGLEAAAAPLMMEAMAHGVGCGVVYPGYINRSGHSRRSDIDLANLFPGILPGEHLSFEEAAAAICNMISDASAPPNLMADSNGTGWFEE